MGSYINQLFALVCLWEGGELNYIFFEIGLWACGEWGVGSLINYYFWKSPRWGGMNKLIFLWGGGGGEGGRY